MLSRRRTVFAAAIVGVIVVGFAVVTTDFGRRVVRLGIHKMRRSYTVDQRLVEYSSVVDKRLRPTILAAGSEYPPTEVAYLVFKDARQLEIYARSHKEQAWVFVTSYSVLGLSGVSGPKRLEGDGQVPEGIYRVESLNPNSRFHLSLRLNYPNEFDRQMAAADGRSPLGSDIMIHGGNASIGCIAIGNDAAEDLFVLTACASKERIPVVICPTDFRQPQTVPLEKPPGWVADLYESLAIELNQFPKRK